MTETTEKVDSIDARQASMSRVTTQDTLLASLAGPASEDPKEKSEGIDKPEGGEQKPAKKSPQERIVELAHKRREAEAKADAEKQRADALEIKLRAMEAQAQPLEDKARPARANFASDDDYVDALTDWKAEQAIMKRERQQAEARVQAEQAEVAQQWDKRQQQAIAAIPDYAEIIGNSEVVVPPYVHQALLESEKGPEIAYYLALHPEEAKKIAALKPLAALKRINSLEADLMEDDEPAPKATVAKTEAPKKSKAPEPITPIRASTASDPGTASSFEEYRKRRLAQKAR